MSLASTDLDESVVDYLSGPEHAHDIEMTGSDAATGAHEPLGSSLPCGGAVDVGGDAHAGRHPSALAVGLVESGGCRGGSLALLHGDRRPPTSSARRRLLLVTGLLAHGIDPICSLSVASRLVSGAFAGVLLFDEEAPQPLPALPGDELLTTPSMLLETVRARLIPGETHMSFLWPLGSRRAPHGHVRATYLAVTESTLPDLRGMLLLSSPGELHRLTSRELEVLGMLVDGCSNQQMARGMVVAVRTVAAHMEHILAKLSSPSRTHAAVHAQREGLYVPLAAGAGAGCPHPPPAAPGQPRPTSGR